MQPKRQVFKKCISSVLLLVLFVAWLPANLVMASSFSPQQFEHHPNVTSACGDDKLTTSQISESATPNMNVLHTDTCQGEGCHLCSSCTAMNRTFSYSNQVLLTWKQHYLSHLGIATTKRLERPPKS